MMTNMRRETTKDTSKERIKDKSKAKKRFFNFDYQFFLFGQIQERKSS